MVVVIPLAASVNVAPLIDTPLELADTIGVLIFGPMRRFTKYAPTKFTGYVGVVISPINPIILLLESTTLNKVGFPLPCPTRISPANSSVVLIAPAAIWPAVIELATISLPSAAIVQVDPLERYSFVFAVTKATAPFGYVELGRDGSGTSFSPALYVPFDTPDVVIVNVLPLAEDIV